MKKHQAPKVQRGPRQETPSSKPGIYSIEAARQHRPTVTLRRAWHFLALFGTFWHYLAPPVGARAGSLMVDPPPPRSPYRGQASNERLWVCSRFIGTMNRFPKRLESTEDRGMMVERPAIWETGGGEFPLMALIYGFLRVFAGFCGKLRCFLGFLKRPQAS